MTYEQKVVEMNVRLALCHLTGKFTFFPSFGEVQAMERGQPTARIQARVKALREAREAGYNR